MVAFLVAPYIDHATQLMGRLGGVLDRQFGAGWRANAAELVCDDNVSEITHLKRRLADGVRVFVSTDCSASLLQELAEHAKNGGHDVLCVKDEAHYNSEHTSASTRLLRLAEVGIVCTATPDTDVMSLPGLQRTLQYPLADAIANGFCADYRVALPLVTTVEEGLLLEASELACQDKLGASALFLDGGMIRDGGRRAIAYARSVNEAVALDGFLERACAFHGAGCATTVVVQHTKNRDAKYKTFLGGSTEERKHRDHGQPDVSRPVLHFLVAVQILDQCVDLPECDSILISAPPTMSGDAKSAHRAIQRMGRATQPKLGNRVAHAYIFSDHDNPWLQQLFDVLTEFDPRCSKRLRVRSTNPVAAFTERVAGIDHESIQSIILRYDIGGAKRMDLAAHSSMQMVELGRLVLLVHANAIDPKMGKPAKMPAHRDKCLNLGELWNNMKKRNIRLGDLQVAMAGSGVDVATFVDANRPDWSHRIPLDDQVAEIARLMRLAHASSIDPETGKAARMPKSKTVNSCARLWTYMKQDGRHVDKLRVALDGSGIDVDAFIASMYTKFEAPKHRDAEQIAYLARLVRLVHAGDTDPKTGCLAHMPTKEEPHAMLWNRMKQETLRLINGERTTPFSRYEQLRTALDGSGVDLDKFIDSKRGNGAGKRKGGAVEAGPAKK